MCPRTCHRKRDLECPSFPGRLSSSFGLHPVACTGPRTAFCSCPRPKCSRPGGNRGPISLASDTPVGSNAAPRRSGAGGHKRSFLRSLPAAVNTTLRWGDEHGWYQRYVEMTHTAAVPKTTAMRTAACRALFFDAGGSAREYASANPPAEPDTKPNTVAMTHRSVPAMTAAPATNALSAIPVISPTNSGCSRIQRRLLSVPSVSRTSSRPDSLSYRAPRHGGGPGRARPDDARHRLSYGPEPAAHFATPRRGHPHRAGSASR